MPATRLTDIEWDQIHARALTGESVNAIARDIERDAAALYRMLGRRYGFKASEARTPGWSSAYNPPTEVADLAYMAGLLDGECSIMHLNNSRGPRSRTQRWIWVVKVSMTDEPIIRWLHSHGGTFSPRPSTLPNRKDQWCWSLNRQGDVETLLRALLPYMRVRRDRAVEALESLEARRAGRVSR